MCLVRLKNINILLLAVLLLWSCMLCSLWSDRKDLYDNGKPTDAIRNELDRAEGAKQDIAGTASDVADTSAKLENAIGTATDASSNFESILSECQSIIDAVRKQSTD
nr:MAG: hypothetical protein [Bacteriophage sp.]